MKDFKLPNNFKSSFNLIDVEEPNLYRELFPFSEIPKIMFDNQMILPNPPKDFWITDTTFRDGQQARAPYTVAQVVHLYSLLHKLGGPEGIIRQCEFFIYSERDRQTIEECRAKGFKYPEITSWIRANSEDFKLVKQVGLKETGILTSVSDYHIFMKLKKSRMKVMEEYLGIVKDALSEGIIPRCHFEDITRADIYGFCLPFAEELMKLSVESKIPIKIRLCDTMGYGTTYPGATLPRSVPRLAHAFNTELGYPAELLEWHGHNDFHQVHINSTTAWLYGIGALNSSLLGYGERTGNSPLEGAIIEYIQLKGDSCGIDTRVITEIGEYFKTEIKAEVPTNYPFIGEDFNTTRAGIHADGIMKDQEIYNIFDTEKLLDRPLKVMITDKSGIAGVAHWINEYIKSGKTADSGEVSKRHPGIRRIYNWIMSEYDAGRTTVISTEEMVAQSKHYIPSLFESDFIRVKGSVIQKAVLLSEKIAKSKDLLSLDPKKVEPFLHDVLSSEGSIQLIAVTNADGFRISQMHTQRGEKALFRRLLNKDFKKHDWFINVVETGEIYISDLFFSKYTKRLIITVALPIKNNAGKVIAVVDIDFIFEELVKIISRIPNEVMKV